LLLTQQKDQAWSLRVDPSKDPRVKFDPIPNHCSDKALALFISWKCFHQNCGKSTSDGIYSAFKK